MKKSVKIYQAGNWIVSILPDQTTVAIPNRTPVNTAVCGSGIPKNAINHCFQAPVETIITEEGGIVNIAFDESVNKVREYIEALCYERLKDKATKEVSEKIIKQTNELRELREKVDKKIDSNISLGLENNDLKLAILNHNKKGFFSRFFDCFSSRKHAILLPKKNM